MRYLFIVHFFSHHNFYHRLERVWMVQTEQQYICIHQCLLAVLEGKENLSSIPREIHDNQGYEGKQVVGRLIYVCCIRGGGGTSTV